MFGQRLLPFPSSNTSELVQVDTHTHTHTHTHTQMTGVRLWGVSGWMRLKEEQEGEERESYNRTTQRVKPYLSPTQVNCSISVITSAISNFNLCNGEDKQISLHAGYNHSTPLGLDQRTQPCRDRVQIASWPWNINTAKLHWRFMCSVTTKGFLFLFMSCNHKRETKFRLRMPGALYWHYK